MKTVAALFVATNGPYSNLSDVDPWDIQRDARKYSGPYPIVAHPPCERWGQYATGGPNPKAKRRAIGDDNGCFSTALQLVRRFGGVIEHPRGSKAWAYHAINKPSPMGWTHVANRNEWTCCVAQGHYGHPASKQTWLFVSGISEINLPKLIWGPCTKLKRIDPGYRSKHEAKKDRSRPDYIPMPRLNERERVYTPDKFRDLLISIAKQCQANVS